MNPGSTLQIEADVDNLVTIRQFVQQTTAALGVGQEAQDDVILAVEEAATNIIVHGYQNQPGMIEIDVRKAPDQLIVCLKDRAPNFDPIQVAPPDLTLPLEKRPPGKMGLHLIRQLVDEISYEIPLEGGNQLTLIKTVSIKP
jgi:serine/threonine-protein kinase RsbW